MSLFAKNLLKDYGYEVIALPKADIAPLLLLYRTGNSLSSLNAPIDLLFEEGVRAEPLPTTSVPDISGRQLLSTDINSGFGFLSNLFKAFGLNSSKLDGDISVHFGKAVNISFEEIIEEKISHLDLDNFLTGAIPKADDFRTYTEKLLDSELYVITQVLKSKSFTLSLEKDNSQKAHLDAALEELATANASIDRRKENEIVIATQGEAAMAFAFKAVRIIYNKQSWFKFWDKKQAGFTIKNQEGLTLREAGDFPVDALPSDLATINL